MFEYLTADGTVQFIHIQVKLPGVLVDFCIGWGVSNSLTVIGQGKESSKGYIKFRGLKISFISC